MSRILTVALGVAAAGMAAAQVTVPSTYGSRTGFGSVLFPGTGHAPRTIVPSITRPGGSFGGMRGGYATAPRRTHPSHSRRVIVPYPVYVGGYYGGFDTPAPYYPDQPQPAPYMQQQAPPPVVIINQAYRPETANPVIRDYSDVPLPEPSVRTYDAPVHAAPDPKEKAAAREESERPTIFLIAFKDHTILPALAYWVEDDTLHYVTRDGNPNRASLSLVDRDFSRQLNRERNVDFNLP